MKWLPLRKSSAEPLAVTMAGIKLGNRVLFVGCSDPILIAGIAVKTGLTGRACAVDEREAATAHAADVAQREGALIETMTAPLAALPLDAEAFDVAIVRDALAGLDPSRRAGCLSDVHRVLRPGGRCLVIDSAPGGLAGFLRRTPGSPDYDTLGGAARALESGGFRAVRTLTRSEGLLFAEGIKANV